MFASNYSFVNNKTTCTHVFTWFDETLPLFWTTDFDPSLCMFPEHIKGKNHLFAGIYITYKLIFKVYATIYICFKWSSMFTLFCVFLVGNILQHDNHDWSGVISIWILFCNLKNNSKSTELTQTCNFQIERRIRHDPYLH